MSHAYGVESDASAALPASEVVAGLVCAARSGDTWYRVQVVDAVGTEDAEGRLGFTVLYLDSGGYDWLAADELRKIRADFLLLPFQVHIIHIFALS